MPAHVCWRRADRSCLQSAQELAQPGLNHVLLLCESTESWTITALSLPSVVKSWWFCACTACCIRLTQTCFHPTGSGTQAAAAGAGQALQARQLLAPLARGLAPPQPPSRFGPSYDFAADLARIRRCAQIEISSSWAVGLGPQLRLCGRPGAHPAVRPGFRPLAHRLWGLGPSYDVAADLARIRRCAQGLDL